MGWASVRKYVEYKLAVTSHASYGDRALLRVLKDYKKIFGVDKIYFLYLILLFATIASWVAMITTV